MAIKLPKKISAAALAVNEQPQRRLLSPNAELLSIREAAKFAKVSGSTIRRWVNAQLIPRYNAGSQIRLVKEDILKFLMQD